jgi:hypothetical protein
VLPIRIASKQERLLVEGVFMSLCPVRLIHHDSDIADIVLWVDIHTISEVVVGFGNTDKDKFLMCVNRAVDHTRMSKRAIARALDMDSSHLNRRLKGEGKFKIEHLMLIGVLAEWNVDEINILLELAGFEFDRSKAFDRAVLGEIESDVRSPLEIIEYLREERLWPQPEWFKK